MSKISKSLIRTGDLSKIKVEKPRKYDAAQWDNIKFDFGSARRITPSGPEAQQFVRAQLRSRARYVKNSGNGMVTQCPFHQSDEGFSMTLNVNIVPHDDNHNRHIPTGFYRCWSCKAAGPWNTLAAEVGMEPLEETDNYELGENTRKLEYDVEYVPPNPALLEELEEDWDWHHKDVVIPYKTLLGIGAKMHECSRYEGNDLTLERRLWLPCYIDGELQGHVDAALNGEQPKYLNADGGWAHSCFLYWDYAIKLANRWKRKHGAKKFIFVCEGPASAAALLRWGFPAVACLGVTNWSEAKAVQLAANFDVVFAVGDGDTPGYDFNDSVKDALNETVTVKRLRLKKDMDPAKFRKAEKQWLLDLIEKHALTPDEPVKPKQKRKKK